MRMIHLVLWFMVSRHLHVFRRSIDDSVKICLAFVPRDRSLHAQPISTQKVQSRKSPQTSARLVTFSNSCLPCLIIIRCCYFDYRINKPFTCSCCVICVSCSVHVISTFYERKGSLAFFYRNYPQINKSDHVVVHTPCARASCSASVSNPSLMNTIGPCSRA